VYRLKVNLQHDGLNYPSGTEVDLDAIGLDAKSMVAQGDAEAVEMGDTRPTKEATPTEAEGTKLGGEAQTMDRKSKG
jgi:hypothetical protein